MKKLKSLIGLIVLSFIEFIFYLNGGRDDLESFFLIWAIVWLAVILFGLFNTFQKGYSYNTASPAGHPYDFLVNSQLKVNGKINKASISMVLILIILFAFNVIGYIVYM